MTASVEDLSVAVAGGGVAGLATARALALNGAEVTVHEQAPAFAEVGAGLQISPNGMRALAALGLDEALRAVALPSQGARLVDGLSGRQIVAFAPRETTWLVHRARLIDVLKDGAEAAGALLRTGSRLSPDAEGADLLVGADGIRSAFRTAVDGGGEPSFSGQAAWRAIIRDPGGPPVTEVFLGPGRHLVSYPILGGFRNIVAAEDRADWTAEGWHHEDLPIALRAAFARFPDRVQRWLGEVEKVHIWGLFRHRVARRWADARRVLVGDAAHPTLPYLAQGANLALEDAVALARALAGPGREAYTAHRRDRAEAVVAAARANACRFHLSNPLVRQAAFAALRALDRVRPGAAGRQFDWVWEYDAATAPL
ncbi:MAG: FAD-dependent monooxygenase [Paracoccaceae bacterium]|nr:FAD-dependent monooxygenase [Paracoccaceae bacterium]